MYHTHTNILSNQENKGVINIPLIEDDLALEVSNDLVAQQVVVELVYEIKIKLFLLFA